MSTIDGIPRPLARPDSERESSQVFTTKREARAFVRNVVAAIIENEQLVYGNSAEGWFLGDVHDARTRELISAAVEEFKAKLVKP